MNDTYSSYEELSKHELEGKDYEISFNNNNSLISIIAPHGGKIEPGTPNIAREIADGGNWNFYSFIGIKNNNNRVLHITSSKFDEPICEEMAKKSEFILTIHGCHCENQVVYIGGLHEEMKINIEKALKSIGINVLKNKKYLATDSNNICNKSNAGKGVQLEISRGLRNQMFSDFPKAVEKTPLFYEFVNAILSSLSRVVEI